jgi:hypothetical protein
MILYDPDPTQLLKQEIPNYITIKLPSGGFILAEPTGNMEMKVVSINSTDPQDYLEAQYQPGKTLKMTVAADRES